MREPLDAEFVLNRKLAKQLFKNELNQKMLQRKEKLELDHKAKKEKIVKSEKDKLERFMKE